MRRVYEAPDYWVPENYIYLTAEECLKHHDQAAAGVLDMKWQEKYDKAIKALKEIRELNLGYDFDICEKTLKELGEIE